MARVLIPLADGFEEMEGMILIDVLRRAGAEVISAGLKEGIIIAARGTRHLADTTIDSVRAEDFDMVVLPGGGPGAKNLQASDSLRILLKEMKVQNRYIGAICAAANVLRNHCIIEEKDFFTCFPKNVADGEVGIYCPDERVVRSGKIVTSVGPGSSFEFALELTEILFGSEVRAKTEGPLQLPQSYNRY